MATMTHSARGWRGLGAFFAILICVGRAAALAQAGGQNPEPGKDLVVLEGSVEGGVFTAGMGPSSIRICFTNTNSFSNITKGFLPGDELALRIPGSCGALNEQTPGNSGSDLTVYSTAVNPVLASDFLWSLTSSEVNLAYVGPPKVFLYEDKICLIVKFAPTSASDCVLEYRLMPRATNFSGNGPNGVNRIFAPQIPSSFPLNTIQPVAGPPGPPGPPGPEGPPGPAGNGEAWLLQGNAGTTPGTDFLGTTDDVAFQIHVNGERAFRLEPNATSPNLIGAYFGNSVFASAVGATIGGGGQLNLANRALDNFGTVGGGAGNQAGTDDGQPATGTHATVGGGRQNMAAAGDATVSGGFLNKAIANFGTVAGGQENTVAGVHAAVGGGFSNEALANFASVLGGNNNSASAIKATVAGGNENTATADSATIGGGSQNNVIGLGGTIAGGRNNVVSAEVGTVGGGYDNKSALNATVSGGYSNTASGYRSTVSGGFQNIASGQEASVGGGASNNASGLYATISGGAGNVANELRATVGGGQANSAFFGGTVGGGFGNNASGEFTAIGGGLGNVAGGASATVAGGRANSVTGHYSVVGGGIDNAVRGANYSTIAGGHLNVTDYQGTSVGGGELNYARGILATIAGGYSNATQGSYSVVGGGAVNRADGNHSTIGGGEGNAAGYPWSTVPGGRQNSALGNYSLAAGHRAKALDHGDFVWADSTDEDFVSTRRDQFLIRAAGGVGIGMNSPETQFHVTKGLDSTLDDPAGHVAVVENSSLSAVNGPDVLALKVQETKPAPGTNYITFFAGTSPIGGANPIGAIEGDGAGGVTYKSGSADFAEWLPRVNPDEVLEEGDVVGLFHGKVSRATRSADRMMVISSRPIVLGNTPSESTEHLHARVAFLGQVRVKVLGLTDVGDYILASGRDDGIGIAVKPDEVRFEDLARIVGRAWDSSDDPTVKLIRTVVGLEAGTPATARLVELIQEQRRTIVTLGNSLNAFIQRVEALERKELVSALGPHTP